MAHLFQIYRCMPGEMIQLLLKMYVIVCGVILAISSLVKTCEFLSQVWDITEEATETKEGEKETFRKDLKNEKAFSQCEYKYKGLFTQDIGMRYIRCVLAMQSLAYRYNDWLHIYLQWPCFIDRKKKFSLNPVIILIMNFFQFSL